MDDNGKKTEETLAQERLERYQKDPLSFVELQDVIHMTVRNPKSPIGISVFRGNAKRSEVDLSWSELNFVIHKSMAEMDIASAMKHQANKNLIHKAGDFLAGVRRMK
jgi:hypothetical protein